MTGVVTVPPTHQAEGEAPSRFEARLLRGAEVIVRYHKLVILIWVVLIAAAVPLALKLPHVLTKQGASKIVPGTDSAHAERLVAAAFPQRSERQVTVVVSAPDVYAPQTRQYLAALDDAIAERVRSGQVEGVASAYTLYRDATVEYLRQAHRLLLEQATKLVPDTAALDQAWPAVVTGAVQTGQLPVDLADLLRRMGPRLPPDLAAQAGRYAAGADWRTFAVPVPAEAVRPLISADGQATLVSVSFSAKAGRDPDVGWLRKTATGLARQSGLGSQLSVQVTGELALIADTYDRADRDNALMSTAAYVVIAVVLLLFFRAVVPTVLTIAMVGLAMNVSQAALWALGHQVTLTQFTVTIMTFVMLGAGVDYSMLLSSRYRQQRVAGAPPREAVVRATASAGESVLLAAAAVVIAFGVALLSPVDWVPPLGYGGLVGIPIIFLAVLTLTPSMLALMGDRFFWLGWRPLTDLENGGGLARQLRRLSNVSRRHRVAVTVFFVLMTIPFAWLAASAPLSADPVALSAPTDSKVGFEVVAHKWGKSTAFPTTIVGRVRSDVATGDKLTASGYAEVTHLSERISIVDGVSRVETVTQPFGRAWTADEVDAAPAELRNDYLSSDGVLRVVVVLRDDPYSDAARQTVGRVESVLAQSRPTVGELLLGGSTKIDAQYGDALSRSFWQLVLLVSVAVALVLMLALGSLLIPLRLVATLMISNVWAIGITVLVFHWIRHEVIINDLPVFLIILMMGLGMDYEIFLVTRIRDLIRRRVPEEDAVGDAVVDTGRVIGAAGLVMAGSLGAMVLSSTLMLRQYGVGLGVAVLLDATLIRMLLVPALLLMFRRYNWWMPTLRRSRQPVKT